MASREENLIRKEHLMVKCRDLLPAELAEEIIAKLEVEGEREEENSG